MKKDLFVKIAGYGGIGYVIMRFPSSEVKMSDIQAEIKELFKDLNGPECNFHAFVAYVVQHLLNLWEGQIRFESNTTIGCEVLTITHLEDGGATLTHIKPSVRLR